ncbi:MAG: WD40 repeat domain-containing protein [Candidatus Xenobia bacterium]
MSCKPFTLAALAATMLVVGCSHPAPAPSASPSAAPSAHPSASEAPSASASVSASASAAIAEKEKMQEMQGAVADVEHHQEKDAIPILQKVIAEDPKNGEAHFWLFQAYKATDAQADRSSNAYKEAHTVVSLMGNSAMGQQAQDFIHEVERTHPTNVNGTFTWWKELKVGQAVCWAGFAPKGDTLVTFDLPQNAGKLDTSQARVQVWNVGSGKAWQPAVSGGAYGVAMSGTTLVVACDDLEVFSLANQQKLRSFPVLSPSIALSPDGKLLAVEQKNTVELLDMANGKPKTTLTQEPKADDTTAVSAVAWSPDGSTLASASAAEVKLWNARDGSLLQTLQTVNVSGLAFSRDSKMLATPDRDKQMRVWDVKTGKVLATLEHDAPGFFNDAVGFAPNGTVAGPADNLVKVWDARTGEYQHGLQDHVDKPSSASFNGAGNVLAAGCMDDDGTVQLWKVAPGPPPSAASSASPAASSASPAAASASPAAASGSPSAAPSTSASARK